MRQIIQLKPMYAIQHILVLHLVSFDFQVAPIHGKTSQSLFSSQVTLLQCGFLEVSYKHGI